MVSVCYSNGNSWRVTGTSNWAVLNGGKVVICWSRFFVCLIIFHISIGPEQGPLIHPRFTGSKRIFDIFSPQSSSCFSLILHPKQKQTNKYTHTKVIVSFSRYWYPQLNIQIAVQHKYCWTTAIDASAGQASHVSRYILKHLRQCAFDKQLEAALNKS